MVPTVSTTKAIKPDLEVKVNLLVEFSNMAAAGPGSSRRPDLVSGWDVQQATWQQHLGARWRTTGVSVAL